MDKQNVRVFGDAVVQAGEYNHIFAAGDLEMQGDITAASIKVAGDFDAKGGIEVSKLDIYGDAEIQGFIRAEDASFKGDVRLKSPLHAEEFSVYGEVAAAKVEAKKIKVYGSVDRAEELVAEELVIKGVVLMDGVINAETAKLRLLGNSKVREIYCTALEILAGDSPYQGVLSGLVSKTTTGIIRVDLIEGDDIFLENTHADVVRGARVVLGKHTVVRRVEYSEQLKVHETAEVTEQEDTGAR